MNPIVRHSIGIDGKVFEDRRAEPRRRVLQGGRLSFNRGFGALECLVRNRSQGGARLSFGDAAAVPAQFDLVISSEERARRARVRWRLGSDVGVELD